MSQLIYNDIKQMIHEVSNGSTPTNFLEGTVVQTEPLKINVDGNTEYFPSSAFIVPESMTDMKRKIRYEGTNQATGEGLVFEGDLQIYNHLTPGDIVLLCQTNGGQKVIVLDRLKNAAQ